MKELFPVVKDFHILYPFYFMNKHAGSIRSAEFSSGPRKINSGWPFKSTVPYTPSMISLMASTYYINDYFAIWFFPFAMRIVPLLPDSGMSLFFFFYV